jgi:hypothetical protein
MSQLEAVRITHPEADTVLGKEFRGKHSCLGLKRKTAGVQSQEARSKPGIAACPVTTHLGFASIGIIITHPEKCGSSFNGDQTIGADSAVTITETGDLLLGKGVRTVAIIHHDKVVSGAIHLGELQSHRWILN